MKFESEMEIGANRKAKKGAVGDPSSPTKCAFTAFGLYQN
jgi:hypothetical protein